MSKIHELRSERATINDRVQALASAEAATGALTAEQQADEQEKETAGASITLVQSFAAALGAALAGTIANLAGVNGGGADAASNAAFWLFVAFIIPSALGIFTAWRSVSQRRLSHPDRLACSKG